MCLFFDPSVRDKVIAQAKKDHAKRKDDKLKEASKGDKEEDDTTAEENKEATQE